MTESDSPPVWEENRMEESSMLVKRIGITAFLGDAKAVQRRGMEKSVGMMFADEPWALPG